MMEKALNIFISYAHEDEALRQELEKHLSLLKRQNLIEVWHDRDINAGMDWEQAVSAHLNTAHIILLLISPSFMASDYCYSIEMKRAIERHQLKEACVIPIILRPVDWEGAPFGQFQALPTDAAPIVSHRWQYQDEAFVDAVKGLRKAIRDFRPERVEQEGRSSVQEISYIGKQIGGYVLVQEIGNGTYGRVYWATDLELPSRSVAIKVMKPVHQDIPDKREHFLQESQILRPLKHPYILPIIDAGLYEGLPYIVTEFAPNGSLRERLNRLSAGGFPLEEALAILSQAGQALDYAHQHDIIHRDLKPENILFTASDKVLLADFGLALVSSAFENEGLDLAGTLQYMAPEQFAGHAEKASDQYALGCIAYELLTGRTPFPRGGFASMWFKHVQSTPSPLTHYAPLVPSHIERAVLKALAKKPGERFADISAFLTALYKDKEEPPKETHSAYGGGFLTSNQLRRLPVYFLLDCSESMAGDPIAALNESMQMIHRDLMSDPQALETVYISIITFADRADQYQLTPLDQFFPPVLSVGGAKKAIGEAFVLFESIPFAFPTHIGSWTD